MGIGARVAKKRNTRVFFVFNEKRGHWVLRCSGNSLQSSRSVEVYNGGDCVPPFWLCLMVEQHVRIRRSGTENLRCTILQAYWRHWVEAFTKLDVVEMVLHSRRCGGCQNAPAAQCSWSELGAPGKKNCGLVASKNRCKLAHTARCALPYGWYFTGAQGRTTIDRPFQSYEAFLCRQGAARSTSRRAAVVRKRRHPDSIEETGRT